MRDLTAAQLRELIDTAQQQPVLLDVREEWEFRICHLEGSLLVPMHKIPDLMGSLAPAQETVVICHHGFRSRQVCAYLAQNGFTNLINLSGGVHEWARRVDPAMAIY